MNKKNPGGKPDLRRFLFRATGGCAPSGALDPLDSYDNLIGELDRLAAVGELLLCASGQLDPGVVGGIACLLKDVEERMRTILGMTLPRRRP